MYYGSKVFPPQYPQTSINVCDVDVKGDQLKVKRWLISLGMDCFGPFIVREGRKDLKRYGVIFTSMSSHQVHIEELDDMTTDAFINALRCFIAIRGPVQQLRSDQGSNFVRARDELASALKKLDSYKIKSYLTKSCCDFIMNVPYSSHRGGVWERQIRTTRSILNNILNDFKGSLDTSSLCTFFYEVMASSIAAH